MKKIVVLLSLILIICFGIGLVGCNNSNIPELPNGITVTKDDIEITYTEGIFPEGAVLDAQFIQPDSQMAQEIELLLADKSFDKSKKVIIEINALLNGEFVQPNGPVLITINKPFEDIDRYVVFHIKEDNVVEELKPVVKENKISITLNSFSKLFIAEEATENPSRHEHEFITKVTEPTCEERGFTTFTCSCGHSYKDDYVDELGHLFINYIPNGDADYEKDGTKTATCERPDCNQTNTITDDGSKLIYSSLIFNSLKPVEEGENSLSGKINNQDGFFSFDNEVITIGNATYTVYSDENCQNEVSIKSVQLKPGKNIFYIVADKVSDGRSFFVVSIYRELLFIVTIDLQNDEPVQQQNVQYNELAQEPTTPTKEGYTFKGWNFDFNTPIVNHVMIMAEWQINTYTIHFDGNDATGGDMSNQTFEYNQTCTLQNVGFTKTGYTFDGWTCGDKEYTNKQVIETLPNETDMEFTFVAKWRVNTYTIMFNGDLATGYMEAKTLSYGETFILPLNTFERVGYTFIKWHYFDEDECDEFFFEEGQSISNLTTVDGSVITLKAKWEAHVCTIHFDGNGATSGEMQDQELAYDSMSYLSSNKFAKIGYTFDGWLCDGKKYTNGQSIYHLTAEDGKVLTFVAQWKANTYMIHFDGNGANDEEIADQVFTYDVEQALTENTYSIIGYTFDGWTLDGQTFTNQQQVKNLTSINGNTIILKAQWKPNTYTIHFDGNGNTSGEMLDLSCLYGENKALTENSFVKTGYTFVGWGYNGSTYNDKQSIFSLTPENDKVLTFVAKWIQNSYTIKFIGEGVDDYSYQTFYFDVAKDLTLNTFEKEGYTFAGWLFNNVVYQDGQQVCNLTTESEEIEFVAQWTANKYSICFEDNGATIYQKFTYDESQKLLKNSFEKEGYHFIGWKYDGIDYIDEQEVCNLATNGLLTFDAQWQANTYSVKFDGNGATDGEMSNQYFTYDRHQELSNNEYSKIGYTFDCWKLGDYTFTNMSQVLNMTSVNNDMLVLTAQWTANTYIIHFNSNSQDYGYNVTGTMQDQYFRYDESQALDLNKFENLGYSFNGWLYNEQVYTNGQEVLGLTYNNGETLTFTALWTVNKYTINFDANGGDGFMSSKVVWCNGPDYLPLNQFTKTGYTFAGWVYNGNIYEDKGFIFIALANDNEEITFVAQWKKNTCTVTFDSNGGGNAYMPPQTFTYGEAQNLTPNAYIKHGYTFDGWKYGERTFVDGESVNDLADISTCEITLTAQWRINTYTITFDGNGATSGEMENQTFEYDKSDYLNENKYLRMGYTFKGWKYNGNDTIFYDKTLATNVTTEDAVTITFFAQWEAIIYTVRFDGNGGMGYMSNIGLTYDVEQQLPENEFNRIGYDFIGWLYNGVYYQDCQIVKNLTSLNGETKLVAQWQAHTYTIKFDGNGKTSGTMEDQTFEYNVSQKLTANAFEKTGYHFVGWLYNDTTYADERYINNLTDVDNAEFIFVAQWEVNSYNVKFDKNGAYNTMSNQYFTYGVAKNLTENAFEKDGYTFVGWLYNGNIYEDCQNVKNLTTENDATITFVAQWQANTYSVKFDSNGGTGSMSNQTFTYGVAQNLKQNAFEKVGYTFDGWFYSSTTFADCENVNYLATANGQVVTLTAKWKANSYTVIFDGNGATGGNMSNQTFTYGSYQNLSENYFYKTGYTFAGWLYNGNNYSNKQSVNNLTSINDDEITFVVKWQANNYYVMFDGNGATSGEMENQTFVYDVSQKLTANAFEKTGYHFVGWKPYNELTLYTDCENVNNLTTNNGSTVTLKAQWELNSYTIHFEGNGASGSMEDQKLYCFNPQQIENCNFSKTGYHFVGWKCGDETYNNCQVVRLTDKNGAVITFVAQWENNTYTIQFDGNGAYGNMLDQTFTYGDNPKELDDNLYGKIGYHFIGWKYGDETYNNGQLIYNLTDKDEEVITFVAQWEKNTCRVSFNSNGATSGEMSNQEFTYGEAQNLTSNAYIKHGYTFDCWKYGDRTFTDSENVNDLANSSSCEITLTAQWSANKYIVSFDSNGATSGEMSNQEFTYDLEQSLTQNSFYKQGYKFAGWLYNGVTYGDCQIVSNLIDENNATITLVAQWEILYSVTLNKNIDNAGEVNGEELYDFESSVSIKATSYLGYDFIGWYDDEILVSENNEYTFDMPKQDIIYTAKWQVKDEMSNFNFTSTLTTCVITGVIDKTVTEIIVPNYVTQIEKGAMSGCSMLVSIELPFVGSFKNGTFTEYGGWCFGYIFGSTEYENSVETFNMIYGTNEKYFYLPTSLQNVTVQGGLYFDNAFANCSNLVSVQLGDGVTSIDAGTFFGCSSLTSIEIPNSVTSIGGFAFCGCSGLTSIEIPNSVVRIGDSAFSNCRGLTNIEIPNSVTSIGREAFSYCQSLTSIEIPNSVTSIESYQIFGFCTNLKNITLPYGLTEIEWMFYGCSSLESVTIPNSVISIGDYAFFECRSLTSIEISDNVTNIGSYTFSNCSSLQYNEYNNALYLGNENNPYVVLVEAKSQSIESCSINNNCKFIYYAAFNNCSSLTSIVIPKSVTSIGYLAFYGCSGLESIIVESGNLKYHSEGNCLIETESKTLILGCRNSIIPIDNSVKIIGDSAFGRCSNLANIVLPNSVTTIESQAFYDCSSLTSIVIPNSVTSIGHAFYGCSGLESIIVESGNLKYHSEGNCLIETQSKTLIVGCKNSIIPIDDSVKMIGNSAFRGCSNLVNIVLPNCVTTIEDYPFCDCSSLTEITFNGTIAEWNAIEKGEYWDSGTPDYFITCIDGIIEK